MKSPITPKNSVDEFKQLISSYHQKIVQPVINEILANFEQDLSRFQANEEAWGRLKRLDIKLSTNYEVLADLIKNGYLRSKIHEHKINSFFIRDDDNEQDISKAEHRKALYKYKKILSDITTRTAILLAFEKNESAYKPVHFIFAFVDDAIELTQLINKYNLNVIYKITFLFLLQ